MVKKFSVQTAWIPGLPLPLANFMTLGNSLTSLYQVLTSVKSACNTNAVGCYKQLPNELKVANIQKQAWHTVGATQTWAVITIPSTSAGSAPNTSQRQADDIVPSF